MKKSAAKKAGTKKRLTPKQQKFVENVLSNGGNATKAAKDAGYKHPNVQGAQNLVKLSIRDRIDARIAEAKVQTDEVVGTLVSQMRGDLTDLLPDGDEVRELAHARGVSHLIKKLKRTRRLIPQKDGEPEEVITYEFEMYSAQEAAKQLCNVLGLNKKEGENPEDEEKRVEKAIEAYIQRTGGNASREDAIKSLAPFIPEVSRYAN